MAERSYCPKCQAPIVFARAEGALVLCDRQQTLDGDLLLREATTGELVVERTATGRGLYREHVCVFNSNKSDSGQSREEQHADEVVRALAKADRASARPTPKRGTLRFALQVLAREVRALRGCSQTVDDALDDLVATYLPLVDKLPADLVVRLDHVRACRRSDYM